MGLDITIDLDFNEKSGDYTAPCPFCSFEAKGFTEKGTMTKLTDHMSEAHCEPRIGQA